MEVPKTEIFTITKFIRTDNSIVIDIRKRILTTKADEAHWYCTDIDGSVKPQIRTDNIWDTKEDAVKFCLDHLDIK